MNFSFDPCSNTTVAVPSPTDADVPLNKSIATFPIYSTVLGIFTFTKLCMFENALSWMCVILASIKTYVTSVKKYNAFFPTIFAGMLSTEYGMNISEFNVILSYY